MSAARKQGHQNHQIREREQPLIRLDAGGFGGPGDEPQMTALREIVQVIHADASQSGNLVVRENLLARFDGNHGLGPLDLSATTCNPNS